jgi:hypothetical protein
MDSRFVRNCVSRVGTIDTLVRTSILVLVALTAFWATTVSSVAQSVQWTKTFSRVGEDEVRVIRHALSGGSITLGTHIDTGSTVTATFVMRANQLGNEVWYRSLPSNYMDIQALPDNSFLLAGTDHSASGGSQLRLTWLDGKGQVSRDTAYQPGTNVEVIALQTLPNGTSLVVANDSGGGPNAQILVIRIDSRGIPVWTREIGDPNCSLSANAIAAMPDGGCAVAAYESCGKVALVRLDQDGTLVWSRSYAVPEMLSIAVGADTCLMLCGRRDLPSWPYGKGVLFRISSGGDSLWCREYDDQGGGCCPRFQQVLSLAGGNFAVCGTAGEFLYVNAFLLKIDQGGTVIWYDDFQVGGVNSKGQAVDVLGPPLGSQILLAGVYKTWYPYPPDSSDVFLTAVENKTRCCIGSTGDVDMTGVVDVADLTSLVGYLTGAGFQLPCPDVANTDGKGIVDSGDLAALVSYLTGGGYVLPNCP